MEMPAHVQHGSRSHRRDRPQCRSQNRSHQSDPVSSAVLPGARVRFPRDSTANAFACSMVAARARSTEACTAMPAAHQRPCVLGQARESRVEARGGLAAWQQLVIAAYIEKHIAESITVRALARFVYLSSYCFCRAFKRSFGIPPHRYLVQRRTERAKALLASSAWSMTEIALSLGFSRPSSFSAAFRKVTGITPTEYRRTQR
jgi:AraC-like DNA-binding protein